MNTSPYFRPTSWVKQQQRLRDASRPKTPCPCGAEKDAGHLVCRACYQAAPPAARANFRSLASRRKGARQLKAFALTQNDKLRHGGDNRGL